MTLSTQYPKLQRRVRSRIKYDQATTIYYTRRRIDFEILQDVIIKPQTLTPTVYQVLGEPASGSHLCTKALLTAGLVGSKAHDQSSSCNVIMSSKVDRSHSGISRGVETSLGNEREWRYEMLLNPKAVRRQRPSSSSKYPWRARSWAIVKWSLGQRYPP